MKTFGNICYAVCMVSIAACLILAFVMIWVDVDRDFMWKALWSAISCFFASSIALAINREFLKERGRKSEKPED